MFVQDFDRDFQAIVETEEPFALARFHDGEHAILENLPYSSASKWTTVGQEIWLRDELGEILRTHLDRFFIGISPPCCAPSAAHFYRRATTLHRTQITFATIFSNRNYRRVPKLRARFQDAFIVSSGEGDVAVPKNGVSESWDVDAVVEELLTVDRPILVAAGPCANLIIHRYWDRQDPEKRQTIIDVGAALDVQIHGHKTRHYQEVTSAALHHSCDWTAWEPFAPVSRSQRERAERSAQQHAIFKEMQGRKTPKGRRAPSSARYVSGIEALKSSKPVRKDEPKKVPSPPVTVEGQSAIEPVKAEPRPTVTTKPAKARKKSVVQQKEKVPLRAERKTKQARAKRLGPQRKVPKKIGG